MADCVLYLPLWKRISNKRVWNSIGGKPLTVSGTTPGKQGFSFDGDDDYVSIPDPSWTHSKGTISLWYKATNNTEDFLFGISKGDLTNYFYISTGTDKVGIRVVTAATPLEMLTTNVAGSWYHLVVTQDSIKARVYINGVDKNLSNTGTGTGKEWISSISGYTYYIIGCMYFNGAYANDFLGTIGEIIIYKRALNEHEVKYLYQATKWRYLSTA